MGFQYGGGEKNEAVFNQERANKWTDATIPLTGNTTHLSGASPQTAGPLLDGGLYVLVSKNSCHLLATSGSLVSASVSHQYWPADLPTYHITVSGSSEYVSVYNDDGSTVEAWISLTERSEGGL